MTTNKLLAATLGLALIGGATARADAIYDACIQTAKTNADFKAKGLCPLQPR